MEGKDLIASYNHIIQVAILCVKLTNKVKIRLKFMQKPIFPIVEE